MKHALSPSLLLAAALLAAAAAPGADAPLRPVIACDEPVYDFGERPNSEKVEHDFVIRNDGQLSLEIRDIRVGCGCTAAKSSDDVIRPGKTAVIHATLNLSGRSGPQNKSITIDSNDPIHRNYLLQLTGTARRLLEASPPVLVYTGIDSATPIPPRHVEIKTESTPFTILSVTSDTPGVSAAPAESPEEAAAPATTHRISVSIADGAFLGRFHANVNVKTDIDNLPPLPIPVSGFIREASAP